MIGGFADGVVEATVHVTDSGAEVVAAGLSVARPLGIGCRGLADWSVSYRRSGHRRELW